MSVLREADAPRYLPSLLQKRGQGRIFAAWVWPGGHTRGVQLLDLKICLYILLDFQIWVLDLTKSRLIFGFNHLICENLILTDFQPVLSFLICANLP